MKGGRGEGGSEQGWAESAGGERDGSAAGPQNWPFSSANLGCGASSSRKAKLGTGKVP